MTDSVAGTCDPAFREVREVFAASFADGQNRGAAVAVFAGGRPVVDLWGGVADERSGRPWLADTPCVAFSCTKAVTATAALLVMERAGTGPDEPVRRWWPEFAAHGKHAVTVEDLLTHRVGLPAFDRPLTKFDAADPAAMAAELAGQAPVWEPGTKHGYHALTFGWLVGELVRRRTGRTVPEFVRENFGAELWAGPGELERAARLGFPPADQTTWRTDDLPDDTAVRQAGGQSSSVSSRTAGMEAVQRLIEAYRDPDSLLMRGSTNPAGSYNDPTVLAGGWPGSGMVTTPRALARFYRELIRGDLLRAETLRDAVRERVRGPDEVLALDSAFALGYMRPSLNFQLPKSARATAFGHPGAGGSVGLGDLDHDLAFAFIPNLRRDGLAGDRRAYDLVAAAYAAV
ncbi:CubicO group peptidase, beta-lactamase class C family [Nocardia amikacinitolerans]|uniref:serine hydrolase domain-containing protein n=1 Tax=Nocardia amikacinitolerans TaxID=756689 RepID=UPI000837A762|nr:serine hydrolase domain-containing protein [Nocardia amikacinitolerans]MCP2318880.1 CubicO group peptidase, beta-lactamase class C family [Nocardia amikacinitolerans]